MQLGKLGIWFFTDAMAAPEAAEFVQRIEAQGYGALWIPETMGREPFAHSAWLLANTQRLVIATGIANIYGRDALAAASAQRTLNEQSGGRFLLGLGVSHAPLVQGVRGHEYRAPLATMRAYLEGMAKANYMAVPPAETPRTVIAALGPKMLALAAELADGAHPYLVPPEHTAQAREAMGPDALLCTEQKVLLETDPSRAREIARRALAMYLGLPNYRRNLLRLGFSESDLNDGGSDKVVDSLVAWGDIRAIESRVKAHFDAGADHVCIQPLNPEGLPRPDERVLEALAPGAGA